MIQWFPGHMAKAEKEMEEKVKLVDIIFELVDARIPLSSINPFLQERFHAKPRLLLLTKSSMADPKLNQVWHQYFQEKEKFHLFIDSIEKTSFSQIVPLCRELLQEKILKEKTKGMKERPIRAMVVGIPNVGKSTFINQFVGKRATLVGNKPGVTKAQQWIKINQDIELLDTPGILWPKFQDSTLAFHLALTGAIRDQVFHKDDVILYFLDFLKKYYPESLEKRYHLPRTMENLEILNEIARTKNFLQKNEIEYERVYDLILNEFRSLKLGRITLDRPTYAT